MSIGTLVVIVAVGMLIGLAKGGFGPVLGALATPLLSLTMPVSKAVAMTLPLLMVGDLFALPLYWRQWDMRQIKLLLPAAVVGVLIGTYLLSALPDSWLRPILGGSTLALVIYKLAGERLTARHYAPQDWHGAAAGAASGFGSAVANAGGPPFTAYLMLQNLTPAAFMGTTTLFFHHGQHHQTPQLLAVGPDGPPVTAAAADRPAGAVDRHRSRALLRQAGRSENLRHLDAGAADRRQRAAVHLSASYALFFPSLRSGYVFPALTPPTPSPFKKPNGEGI